MNLIKCDANDYQRMTDFYKYVEKIKRKVYNEPNINN